VLHLIEISEGRPANLAFLFFFFTLRKRKISSRKAAKKSGKIRIFVLSCHSTNVELHLG